MDNNRNNGHRNTRNNVNRNSDSRSTRKNINRSSGSRNTENRTRRVVNETPEERQRRLRRERMRRIKRRRQKIRRLIMCASLCVLLCVILGGLLWNRISKKQEEEQKKQEQEQESQQDVPKMEKAEFSNVLFLSFDSLIANSELAFAQEDTQVAKFLAESRLTVEEFKQVLQQLYQRGYVLISLEDLATMDKNGKMKLQETMLLQGKKPLIIAQQNVSYEFAYSGQGIASRLVLNENGEIKAELVQSDGTISVGDYDVIPCLNTFIKEHPDFSYDGARGIIGLTAHNGILGYRTSSHLAVTEGNKYAATYGLFDTQQEIEKVKPILEVLRNQGWNFACNGYDGYTSYSTDLLTVTNDLQQWKIEVGLLIGETSILLYPNGTDISDWSMYSAEDEKYTYLKKEGFNYFVNRDINGNWGQIGDDYLRISCRNLDGYRIYQEIEKGMDRFANILNFEVIIDETRPTFLSEESIEN